MCSASFLNNIKIDYTVTAERESQYRAGVAPVKVSLSALTILANCQGVRLGEYMKGRCLRPRHLLQVLMVLSKEIEVLHDMGMVHGAIKPDVVYVEQWHDQNV